MMGFRGRCICNPSYMLGVGKRIADQADPRKKMQDPIRKNNYSGKGLEIRDVEHLPSQCEA
jgi:hypothetical protein